VHVHVCSRGGHAPQQAYVPQLSYQSGTAAAASRPRPPDPAGGGWNGWDEDAGAGGNAEWRSREAAPPARGDAARGAERKAGGKGGKADGWSGFDAGGELPDEVWDADWS
jgi:hypothetical protein